MYFSVFQVISFLFFFVCNFVSLCGCRFLFIHITILVLNFIRKGRNWYWMSSSSRIHKEIYIRFWNMTWEPIFFLFKIDIEINCTKIWDWEWLFHGTINKSLNTRKAKQAKKNTIERLANETHIFIAFVVCSTMRQSSWNMNIFKVAVASCRHIVSC